MSGWVDELLVFDVDTELITEAALCILVDCGCPNLVTFL